MLTAKPQRKPDPTPAERDEAKVQQFVGKGGSAPPAAVDAPHGKGTQHPLKFSNPELFKRLEQARQSGAVKLPRNTWILQAIAEKLERENF